MAPDGSSNIRVFVRWHDQNVFAGEDVKCSITFKNVARPPGSAHGANNANHGGQGPKSLSNSERPRQLSSLQQAQAQGQARTKTGGTLAPPAAPPGPVPAMLPHRATVIRIGDPYQLYLWARLALRMNRLSSSPTPLKGRLNALV